MSEFAGVYLIRNLQNNKVYVGSNMQPEKLKAWRDKLSLKNKSRVRSQYSTDKARETRKLNDALKKIRKEN